MKRERERVPLAWWHLHMGHGGKYLNTDGDPSASPLSIVDCDAAFLESRTDCFVQSTVDSMGCSQSPHMSRWLLFAVSSIESCHEVNEYCVRWCIVVLITYCVGSVTTCSHDLCGRNPHWLSETVFRSDLLTRPWAPEESRAHVSTVATSMVLFCSQSLAHRELGVRSPVSFFLIGLL